MAIVNILSILGILGLGGMEVLLILGVFILLFGAKKLPELARGMGKGIREFKDATSGIKNDIEKGVSEVNKE